MMVSDEGHEAPEEETDEGPEPTVRCDACGTLVAERASQPVVRRYLERAFTETWCRLCVRSSDQATERTLSAGDEEPDY